MGRRVAIVGAALSDCGRVDDKSPFELHYQAASRALADAGLEKSDVDGFASSGTGLLAPIEVATLPTTRRSRALLAAPFLEDFLLLLPGKPGGLKIGRRRFR